MGRYDQGAGGKLSTVIFDAFQEFFSIYIYT